MGGEIVHIGAIEGQPEIGKDIENGIAEAARIRINTGSSSVDFVLAFGSITNAPVDAILNPSGRALDEIFSGGVSWAVLQAAGDELYENAQNLLKKAQKIAQEKGITEPVYLPFTGSIAVPSTGRLLERGVENVIFTNVHSTDEPRTPETIGQCYASTLLEADRVKAKSVAVPAIAGGPLGGLGLEGSLAGVLHGLKSYLAFRQLNPQEKTVQEIYLVLYYAASWENYDTLKDMLREAVKLVKNADPKQLPDSWIRDVAPWLVVFIAAATVFTSAGARQRPHN